MDSVTGLTTIQAPQKGSYALAIAVKEYRNGTLISTTYRDVQIIVIDCPYNPIPTLVTNTQVLYEVIPGDTIQFDIHVSDNDSIFLTRTGDLFDSSKVDSPLPTLPEVEGPQSIRTTFTWATSCESAAKDYFFLVTVKDNGCPGKILNITYTIRLRKSPPPDSILGPDIICGSSQEINYFVSADTSLHYHWVVENGIITSGQGSDTIAVSWDDTSSGTVTCYTVYPNSCDSSEISLPVTLLPAPEVDAGRDTTFCSGEVITIGPDTTNPAWSYQWLTTAGISSIHQPQTSLHLTNGTSGSQHQYYTLQVKNSQCTETDSMLVTVRPPPPAPVVNGIDSPCLYGTSVFSVSPHPKSFYYWEAAGGSITQGQSTSTATIRWNHHPGGPVQVFEVNRFGCKGDTASFPVHLRQPKIDTILGTHIICPNARRIRYEVQNHAGSTYEWFIIGGSQVAGNNTNSILVNWGDSGLGHVRVAETTIHGCTTDTFSLPVHISYRLQTSSITGDTSLCLSTQASYQVQATNGSIYTWSTSGGNILSGQGTAQLEVLWNETGVAELMVIETSYDSVNGLPCTGDPVVLPVTIHPLPKTTSIHGPTELCAGSPAAYSVSGFPGSTFTWQISGQAFTGQDSSSISTTWNDPGTYRMQVVEMTMDSCWGDTQHLIVTVHPLPPVHALEGPELLCSTDSLLASYRIKGLPGSTFGWHLTNGTLLSGQGSDHVHVQWNAHGPGTVKVKETTSFGCERDTLTKGVTIDGLQLQIRYTSTSVPNDSVLHVAWEVLNQNYLNQPLTLHCKAPGTEWRKRQVLSPFTRFFADSAVETHASSYAYRIATTNLCSAQVQAEPHQSILLQGERSGDSRLNLTWNGYHGWTGGVREYEVYRTLNEERELTFYRSAAQDTALALNVGIDGYRQCYRIRAVENAMEPEESWSNLTCAEFDAIVHIPSGFSPNGDGQNDTFCVVASNWRSLELKIYNRWGELLHYSAGNGHGWRGYHGDKPVQRGTYLYVVRIRDNGSFTEYKGDVTLIR